MIKYLLLIVFVVGSACFSLNEKHETQRVEYVFPQKSVVKNLPQGCIASDEDQLIDFGSSFENIFLDNFGSTVTLDDELHYGEKIKDEALDQLSLIEDDRTNKLRLILNKLEASIARKEIPYSIFLVEDEVINAWTHAGGFIYITTGLLNYVDSEDELAFVIAHEIGHNENEHCSKAIQRLKTAVGFTGDETSGTFANNLLSSVFSSFDQHQELEADLSGLYLAYSAGYDPERSKDFFDKLSKNEEENVVDKFLRTHPWSSERVSCVASYLQNSRK